MDDVERVLFEEVVGVPARDFQPVFDVLLHLLAIQRADVEPQPNSLHELFESRRVEGFLQFGLARQDDAQDLFLVGLDSG